jgi:hypothetical protein
VHKHLDSLVVDQFLQGNPSPEDLDNLNLDIVKVTQDMLEESGKYFDEVGKRPKNCFSKGSRFYLSRVPDCIKDKFGILPDPGIVDNQEQGPSAGDDGEVDAEE